MNTVSKALNLIITDIKNYYKGFVVYIIIAPIMDKVLGSVCPSRIFFGIPCPACGFTRASLLLLRGEIYEAINMYPLVIVVYIFAIMFIFFRYFYDKWFDKFLYCGIIILGVVFVVYVYRMIKLFPNTEPMKYDTNNILNFMRRFLYG